MSEISPDLDHLPEELPLEPPRGRPWLAWAIILVLTGSIVGLQMVRKSDRAGRASEAEPPPALLGRLLVGITRLWGSPQQTLGQFKGWESGKPIERLTYAVLAGELEGPAAALKCLENLTEGSESELRLRDLLARLYRDRQADRPELPSLTESERKELRDRLGWFGELATLPQGSSNAGAREQLLESAERAVIVSLVVVLGVGLLILVGGVLLVVLLVLLLRRREPGAFQTGSPYGSVYAETFALWMVLFVGLTVLTALIPWQGGRLVLAGMASLGSLAALAWPVRRGIPWAVVRQDIGLHGGRGLLREGLAGLAAWIMAFPMLVLGVIGFFLLVVLWRQVTGEIGPPPSHPIGEDLKNGSDTVFLQVAILVAVVAPVVEEIVYRGLLYRHLREATQGLARPLSPLVSATIVGFLFAIVHPQGILGVPLLMSLAYAFNLAREWRDSLIASMVAHGLNNGAIVLLLALVGP